MYMPMAGIVLDCLEGPSICVEVALANAERVAPPAVPHTGWTLAIAVNEPLNRRGETTMSGAARGSAYERSSEAPHQQVGKLKQLAVVVVLTVIPVVIARPVVDSHTPLIYDAVVPES